MFFVDVLDEAGGARHVVHPAAPARRVPTRSHHPPHAAEAPPFAPGWTRPAPPRPAGSPAPAAPHRGRRLREGPE